MLPFHATYEDLTTLQYAHFAAAAACRSLPSLPSLLLSYLINSVACLTYSRFPPRLAQCDEQLNGVTVNRGGSVALL